MMNKNDDKNITLLEEKIRNARAKGVGVEKGQKNPHISSAQESEQEAENRNLGYRAGTELLVSVIAGTVIGYWLDGELGTKPVMFLLFFVLGIGTGFWNIYKITNNLGTSVGITPLHKVEKQAKEGQKKK